MARKQRRPRHNPAADALAELADASPRPKRTIRFDFDFTQIDDYSEAPLNQWYRLSHWKTQSLLLYKSEWSRDWRKFSDEVKVVGVTQDDRERTILSFACRPDFRVALMKEPDNPYDTNAVGVWAIASFNGEDAYEQIGYLDRNLAKSLTSEIELNARPCKLNLPHDNYSVGLEITVLVRSAAYKRRVAGAKRSDAPEETL